jgi:hypothetical protein
VSEFLEARARLDQLPALEVLRQGLEHRRDPAEDAHALGKTAADLQEGAFDVLAGRAESGRDVRKRPCRRCVIRQGESQGAHRLAL